MSVEAKSFFPNTRLVPESMSDSNINLSRREWSRIVLLSAAAILGAGPILNLALRSPATTPSKPDLSDGKDSVIISPGSSLSDEKDSALKSSRPGILLSEKESFVIQPFLNAADKITFVTTSHPNGHSVVIRPEPYFEAVVREKISHTAFWLAQNGYKNHQSLLEIIGSLNVAELESGNGSQQLFNRLEVSRDQADDVGHEFIHNIVKFEGGGNLDDFRMSEGLATLIDNTTRGKNLDDILRYNMYATNCLRQANGLDYVRLGKEWIRIDLLLREKAREKGRLPNNLSIGIQTLNTYEAFAHEIPDWSRWGQDMPNSFLLNSLATNYGISFEDIKDQFERSLFTCRRG